MAINAKITDIRVALSVPTNRKIKALRRALGPGACWALLELWIYCAANDPDGALIGWTDDDVEAVANWDGIRGEFVANTVRIGLLTTIDSDAGGFTIHDWAENQPWVATAPARSASAKRAVEARWARSKADTDTERIRGEYEPNTERIPPSLPFPSTSISTTSPGQKSRACKPALDTASFNSFWAAYPKKVAKAAAEKAWAKIPIASHAEIMAAILCQAKSEQWTQEKGKFIPNPATWLNQRRWEDEIAAPAQAPQPAYYQPVEIRKNEISPEEECSSLTDVLETLRKGHGSHQEQRSTQEP